MSKVNEFVPQQLPNNSAAAPQATNHKINANPAAQAEHAPNRAGENQSAQPSTHRQELMSRMPLNGQLLRHSLHASANAKASANASTHHPNSNSAHVSVAAQIKTPAHNPNSNQTQTSAQNLANAAPNSANAATSARVSNAKTVAETVHQGLLKHAEKAGLPTHEQKEFASKFTPKFSAEAKLKGQEKLLGKDQSFSLLASSRTIVEAKVQNGTLTLRLGAKAIADLQARQAKHGLKTDVRGEVTVKLGNDANVKLGQSANAAIKLHQTLHQSAQVRGNTQAQTAFGAFAAGIANNNSKNLQQFTRREFVELRTTVQTKLNDLLRQVGVDVSRLNTAIPGSFATGEKTPENLRETANIVGGNNQEPETSALFASALGIAADSAEESRNLHGDGLLLGFANYAEEKTVTAKEFSLDSLMQNLLQSSSQNVDAAALLETAINDLGDAALDGLAQIAEGASADSTSELVVGVLTMSVMTREVVERLDHIASGSNSGLSDDALAALQKAQNNLRDHLTATDLVGAAGDRNGASVTINGASYEFLPEVSETLNSLREARHRILNETGGASQAESFARYTVEADALLKITRGVEVLLKI